MSEISKNNRATNRVIDDWMIRALEAYSQDNVEHQCVESLLLWWLGFGDRIDDDAVSLFPSLQISDESVQALRTQRLILSALRSAGKTQGPDSSITPEPS
jgi:hypothetical protein